MRVTPIAGFHDADTDTDILARMSVSVSASWNPAIGVTRMWQEVETDRQTHTRPTQDEYAASVISRNNENE